MQDSLNNTASVLSRQQLKTAISATLTKSQGAKHTDIVKVEKQMTWSAKWKELKRKHIVLTSLIALLGILTIVYAQFATDIKIRGVAITPMLAHVSLAPLLTTVGILLIVIPIILRLIHIGMQYTDFNTKWQKISLTWKVFVGFLMTAAAFSILASIYLPAWPLFSNFFAQTGLFGLGISSLFIISGAVSIFLISIAHFAHIKIKEGDFEAKWRAVSLGWKIFFGFSITAGVLSILASVYLPAWPLFKNFFAQSNILFGLSVDGVFLLSGVASVFVFGFAHFLQIRGHKTESGPKALLQDDKLSKTDGTPSKSVEEDRVVTPTISPVPQAISDATVSAVAAALAVGARAAKKLKEAAAQASALPPNAGNSGVGSASESKALSQADKPLEVDIAPQNAVEDKQSAKRELPTTLPSSLQVSDNTSLTALAEQAASALLNNGVNSSSETKALPQAAKPSEVDVASQSAGKENQSVKEVKLDTTFTSRRQAYLDKIAKVEAEVTKTGKAQKVAAVQASASLPNAGSNGVNSSSGSEALPQAAKLSETDVASQNAGKENQSATGVKPDTTLAPRLQGHRNAVMAQIAEQARKVEEAKKAKEAKKASALLSNAGNNGIGSSLVPPLSPVPLPTSRTADGFKTPVGQDSRGMVSSPVVSVYTRDPRFMGVRFDTPDAVRAYRARVQNTSPPSDSESPPYRLPSSGATPSPLPTDTNRGENLGSPIDLERAKEEAKALAAQLRAEDPCSP